jgi:hypothetical protein
VIKDKIKGTRANRAIILQIAVKAINNITGYDSIVPTLLVFGAFPRMTHIDPPAPLITQQATAIKKAMAEVTKLQTQRQVTDVLRTRNRPSTDDIYTILLSLDILVWQVYKKSWNRPYKLLAIKEETATIKLPHGPTVFRTTNIKRYTKDSTTDQVQPKQQENSQARQQKDSQAKQQEDSQAEQQADSQASHQPTQKRQLPAKYRADIIITDTQSKPQPNFTSSRQKKLNGLIKREVFEFVKNTDTPVNARIFNSRFIDQIKREGTPKAYEKSQLVIQAYNDDSKKTVLT